MAAMPIWLTLRLKSIATAVRITGIDEFKISIEKWPHEAANSRLPFISFITTALAMLRRQTPSSAAGEQCLCENHLLLADARSDHCSTKPAKDERIIHWSDK